MTEASSNVAGALLVFGAGANQAPLIAAARRLGLRTIAVDRNAEAIGRDLADRFVCLDLEDDRAIDRAIAGERVRGVVARVTAPGVLDSARRVAAERRLPAPEPELVAAATSKRTLAACFAGTPLRTPARLAHPTATALAEGPLLVRPDVTMRGKAGIHRVDHAGDLRARLDEACARSGNGRCDVSRWIDGTDVTVFVQLDRGRAWPLACWDEWIGRAPDGRIVGLGVGMPARHARNDPAILRAIGCVAERFRESRGLAMVSLRIDPHGVAWVIEIHLGLGGDAIAEQLLPTAMPGFDPFAALVLAQIGGRVAATAARPRPCALVRDPAGRAWRPMTARSGRELRARVRLSVPSELTLPDGLRNDEGPAHARGVNGPSIRTFGGSPT